MIRRAALIPLVVAMCTASLISAGVLQAHQVRAAALAAEAQIARQQMLAAPPPIVVPQNKSSRPATRPSAPAVQKTAAPRAATPARSAPCASTVRACVKMSTRQAWLLDGTGKVILGPVPITSGKMCTSTDPGMWNVLRKDRDYKNARFDDAPMPYAVFFEPGGIAFHTGGLSAQSSGCIHLANTTAAQFFNHLSIGDPVQVLK
jgi:lipoprotein-anchoring transpeptidase ErfK/SrfK